MLSNFYSNDTKVFKRNSGWTYIHQIEAGDRILNVDLEDNRKAFFAPVIRTEKKKSDGCIYVEENRYMPDCQVLVEKYGASTVLTWNQILNMYETNELWDKQKDPFYDVPDDCYSAWKNMCVYASCNYESDRDDPTFPTYIMSTLLAIISLFPERIDILPKDDEGCAIRFDIPRDTVMSSNVKSWLDMYNIAYTEDRAMTHSIISVYNDEIKQFIDKAFICEGSIAIANPGNVLIDRFDEFAVRQIMNMYCNGDMSSFFSSSNMRMFERYNQWGTSAHTNAYLGDRCWIENFNNILGAMCTTHGINVSISGEGDKIRLWFSNHTSAPMFTSPDAEPLYFKDDVNMYYALQTQTPTILISDVSSSGGSIARIAPVG